MHELSLLTFPITISAPPHEVDAGSFLSVLLSCSPIVLAESTQSSIAAADGFDAELSQFLADLKVPAEAREFLQSLGVEDIHDLAVAVQDGDVSKNSLMEHGVKAVPASKLMTAVEQLRNGS